MSCSIPERFYIKLDPATHAALLAALDSSYLPAGTVMVPPDPPPFPSTADEIDRAIAAL